MAEATEVGQFLDEAADQGYLDAINGTTPESLVDAQMKVAQFVEHLPAERSHLPVVSIGVGQGEELHALKRLDPELSVIGLDLSQSALDRTAQRSSRYHLDLLLSRGDARNLPFADKSLGGVVMSAVSHEIYSYFQPRGHESLQRAFEEVARTIEVGGSFYFREFAAPTSTDPVRLTTITEEAQRFCDFFISTFKTGLGNSSNGVGIEMDDDGMLPVTGDLTQLLMHFKNFWNDMTKGSTYIGDAGWKELKESYLIKDTDGRQYMTPNRLCDFIISAAETVGVEFVLCDLRLHDRKKTNLFLKNHVRILSSDGSDMTDTMVPAATAKMEALFQRR